jgi:hypothetical protein
MVAWHDHPRVDPWPKKPHDSVTIPGFAWQQRLASLYYFMGKGIVGLKPGMPESDQQVFKRGKYGL